MTYYYSSPQVLRTKGMKGLNKIDRLGMLGENCKGDDHD